jgi:hypothetical protein
MGGVTHGVASTALVALFGCGCSWPDYDTTAYDAALTPDAPLDTTDDPVDSTTSDGFFDAADVIGESEGAVGDSCVPPLSTSTCSTCLSAKCGSAAAACLLDANCTKRRDCSMKCCGPLTSTCFTACASANPSAAGNNLQTCLEAQCLSACAAP